ncbi:hypothetical protein CS0771_61700 [Catellatospora sp. IY07-71]|uniref:hypothetical protein n=1 Tax=Catellatospora sp. IY07-71 TaxID=2728827 RepID=UPI001BB43549|nr:hypothetical protein [Catellatospora sp. IY07-71]BCJ76626.1 hypothetical protein CS0771_61700 [Catellatospora sp. IY07-71]
MREDSDERVRPATPALPYRRLARRRRAHAAFAWLVLPVLLLAMTVEGAQHLRPSWRAHRNSGTAGVFTVTRCAGADCFGGGEWVSDDGSRMLHGVRLYDAPAGAYQAGSRIRALDTGLSYGVYTAGGSAYLATTAELAAGMFGLIGCLVLLLRRGRGRRRRPLPVPDQQ